MKVHPFLLDRWLEQKFHAHPPIEHDLGSSTGPSWSVRELVGLANPAEVEELLNTDLFYSDALGQIDLRREIATAEGVPIESVLVVTGASEALHLLLFDAAAPHGNVVLPHPVFPPVAVLANAMGLEVRSYVLHPESGFQIDLEEVSRLVDQKTRLVYANSPHNPTGAVLSELGVRALHDLAVDRGAVFVCDQVYHPIYHEHPGPSASRLPHATTVGSLSKAYCLSGLRIGWLVEPNPDRRARLVDLRSYFTISNASLPERLGILAFRHRDTILRRAHEVAQSNLALLDDFFRQQARHLRWVRPAGGFTAFPALIGSTDSRPLCLELARRGVLVVPGDCFGEPAHLRIGFGATQAAEALARFTAVIAQAA